MSSSQLHNPRAVWFLGAPVSKTIAISTVAIYIAAEMNKWHDALILDTTKIFDHAQFYRIFVCNLTFGSMGELIFGLTALCPLLRRFEREVCSKHASISDTAYFLSMYSSYRSCCHLRLFLRWAAEDLVHSSFIPQSSPLFWSLYFSIFFSTLRGIQGHIHN
mmetsp:Transcript_29580/g.71472  ORF Transcript_29580/g.71472 Transcript_29580/m.71472 type:complete len:162 (-) Transcript_29580:713-1198(-)